MGRFTQFVRYTLGPDWLPPAHRKFVVVFLSRTGSNLLAAKLSTHPAVLCHHEMYNPNGIHRALRYKGSDLSFGSLAERQQDPWAFAARIYAHEDGSEAIGFKLSPRQDDWFLLSMLCNRRILKVVLTRRNLVEAYASDQLALRTWQWSRQAGAAAPASFEAIDVDPAAFLRFARKRRVFYALVRAVLTLTGQRGVWLDYEDLGDDARVRGLLDRLGVRSDVALAPQTEKQNPQPLSVRIRNYAALRAGLAGTRYAEFVP